MELTCRRAGESIASGVAAADNRLARLDTDSRPTDYVVSLTEQVNKESRRSGVKPRDSIARSLQKLCEIHMQQNEEPDVPNVPVMPASVTFETKVPEYGWWILRAKIQEEKFENNRVAAWPENSDKKRRSFEFEIACSHVSDPIPDLHTYIYSKVDGAVYGNWKVDEEGSIAVLESWDDGYRLEQIRLRRMCSLTKRDYAPPINLVVDRFDFLDALEKAYSDFGRNGAWKLFSLIDYEDAPEPELVIDSNLDKP